MGYFDEVDEIFDVIFYSKGVSVIRMLYDYVGDEVCNNGTNFVVWWRSVCLIRWVIIYKDVIYLCWREYIKWYILMIDVFLLYEMVLKILFILLGCFIGIWNGVLN